MKRRGAKSKMPTNAKKPAAQKLARLQSAAPSKSLIDHSPSCHQSIATAKAGRLRDL
jgi:hypothetical protein